MPFQYIKFYQFRNLKDARIPVPSEQVFFIGENGQGKSNFLEALYLLCYGSSFRTRKDDQLVRRGMDEASLIAVWDNAAVQTQIRIIIRQGKKEIRINDKLIQDRAELVSIVPCVIFCHEDIDFVKGPPELQRWFFNQTCSMIDANYLQHLRRYTRVLKSRNQVLKDGRRDLLPIYDEQLVEEGLVLRGYRQGAIDLVNQAVARIFHAVSDLKKDFKIQYRPNWAEALDKEQAMEELQRRRDQDLAQRTSTSGPHRDRFNFVYDGADFTHIASTGQFRLISLIMRAAQAEILHSQRGKKPVLLVDDVLLELDDDKRKKFLACLPEFSQAFYTFLPDEHLRQYIQGDKTTFLVKDGEFHEKHF